MNGLIGVLNALQSVNMVWSLQSQMSELAETVVKIIELVKQMLYIHHKYIEKSCAEQVKMIEGFESELYAHINKKVLFPVYSKQILICRSYTGFKRNVSLKHILLRR